MAKVRVRSHLVITRPKLPPWPLQRVSTRSKHAMTGTRGMNLTPASSRQRSPIRAIKTPTHSSLLSSTSLIQCAPPIHSSRIRSKCLRLRTALASSEVLIRSADPTSPWSSTGSRSSNNSNSSRRCTGTHSTQTSKSKQLETTSGTITCLGQRSQEL